MDRKKAFEGAKEKLQIAHAKVAAMRAASDVASLARLWEEFLTAQQQVFLRLKKAFEQGPSKAWCDSITNDQRSDDMLQYAMHARNANEHGIENITDTKPQQLGIKLRPDTSVAVNELTLDARGSSPKVTMDAETAANFAAVGASIVFTPGSIKLVAVRDRGIDYEPPTSHFGVQITQSPLHIAELTALYLSNKIVEAQSKFDP